MTEVTLGAGLTREDVERLVRESMEASEASRKSREEAERTLAQARAAAAEREAAKAHTEPAPAPKPDPVLEAMRAELEDMRRRRLVEMVRALGVPSTWPDARILALAPDVDVRTEEGRLKLEAWRSVNADLFTARTVATQAPPVAELVAQVPGDHPVFGKAYVEKLFTKTLGGGR